ncbi:MAG: ATP-grasp domain-containing protein [Sphingomonadales bacterium]|nr:ATP-grasp domain-containing protein [Sphingomonadales bacterium]MDE2170947.1 ATP-grasp domain-containing protein [Sphingomonadales bacterium]
MSHLLIVDLPGGNDTDILTCARELGHRVSLLTADPDHYRGQSEVAQALSGAEIIAAPGFAMQTLLADLQARHRVDPFAAVLCLQDLRIVESAEIAQALGLRHLNPVTARLARDKAAVRRHLERHGLPQPACLEAEGAGQLLAAVASVGLPALIKPADGFGSQNVFALRTPADLDTLHQLASLVAAGPGTYGLGVMAGRRMLVERLIEGQLIGLDTMSAGGQHRLLAVNEKLMFAPPSFAMRGGCLSVNIGQFSALEAHAFALLDAIGFDHGAAHIEMILSTQGPVLVEINPRLVGARIARLLSAGLGRSVHADLIALHCDGRLPDAAPQGHHVANRWLGAPCAGELTALEMPDIANLPASFTMMARVGDAVTPPLDNADRLGMVMAWGDDRAMAEAQADALLAATRLTITPAQNGDA